jgi:Bacterial protein of unknown function (DUF885)
MSTEAPRRLFAARALTLGLLATLVLPLAVRSQETSAGYEALLALFQEWRTFEKPPLRDGAPDYGLAAMAAQHKGLRALQARLRTIDPHGWPIAQQVDYHLVRAEMNGLDFNHRVLRPWERDPAFYLSVWPEQSDTPGHEGPTHHALIDLWTYSFPLAAADEAKLAGELRSIPPLLRQARQNLVGNARELWLAGIGTMRDQAATLEDLQRRTTGAGAALTGATAAALRSTQDFVAWLEEQAPSKTGPSGIGKENYTWALRNVHLIPMTWEDEVRLLRRELDRAHTSLHLEEQRNRNLPPLTAIATPEEYTRRANEAVTQYLGFLKQNQIMPIRGFMDPALRAHLGAFAPLASRNFFQIVTHYEPMALYTHFYHWWDLARMREEPHSSPVRRGPLLFNIFAARSEGLATGVEEMMMHAGLYDGNPRAREIVWIMLAQRAARGLGSLYVHANDFTLQQARDFHVEWTPRGWMRKDLDLLGFEQQLYLRQPGYGSSYITGKYQIEHLLTERSHQLGDKFKLSDFFAEVDAAGVIPVSLIRWQLTGKDDEIRALADGE